MEKTDQLKILATFHTILGAIAGLFSLFPLIHVGFGVAMVRGVLDHGKEAPPPFIGWLLIGIGTLFIASGLTYAVLVIVAGRNLLARRHYMFCLVIAAIETIFMPFGTVLGVFTIIVLLQEPVKALFTTEP